MEISFGESLLELVLRGIPEGFLYIFAGYAISKYKIHTKRFVLSGFLLALVGYLVRFFLPVQFGIHIIFILIGCFLILNLLNKIPLLRAISASLILIIVAFVTEILNALVIALIKGIPMQEIMKDSALLEGLFNSPMEKLLMGIPSLVVMALIFGIIYYVSYRKNKLKDAFITEDIE